MKQLETVTIEELQALEVAEFQTVEFSIGDFDFRFTNMELAWKLDANYGGTDLYYSRAFTQMGGTYSTRAVVDSSSIKIDNLDDFLTQFFIAGEPEGAQMVVKRYWMDLSAAGDLTQVGPSIIIFDGNIDSWESKDGEISIKMKSEFSQWNQITLRIQSSSCQWKVFTGTECQYAGDENWCDRTYTRCDALNNTANFGGDRWVASIIDKVIWWGRAGG